MTRSIHDELVGLAAFERRLINEFTAHPVLKHLADVSRPQLIEILLQRRFLSLAFTPLYDLAIDACEDPEAKRCLREILREEYPGYDQHSHREDLLEDLIALGATWDQVVSTLSTRATLETLDGLFGLLQKTEGRALYEVKVLTVVRLAGEVLVATEYGCLWPRLEALGLTEFVSKFYYPHVSHDKPSFGIGDVPRFEQPRSHSDRLTVLLQTRIDAVGLEGAECCLSAMRSTASVKGAFYDQFTPLVEHR